MANRAGVLPLTLQWKSQEELSVVCKPRPLPAEHRVLLRQPRQTDGQMDRCPRPGDQCQTAGLHPWERGSVWCLIPRRVWPFLVAAPGTRALPRVCLAEFTGNAGYLRGIDTGGPTRPPPHLGIPLFWPPGLQGQSSHDMWGDVEGRSTCVGGPRLCYPVPTTDRIRRRGRPPGFGSDPFQPQAWPPSSSSHPSKAFPEPCRTRHPTQNPCFRGALPVSPCKGSLALKVCRPQRTLHA